MSVNNPLQFAITREDPEIELEIIRKFGCKNMLAICSGGDTLLAVKAACPEVKVSGLDFNPHQLAHFKNKIVNPKIFKEGNFESLFKLWREFFNEFILSQEDTRKLFVDGKDLDAIFSNKYWPVSFDLFFHDSFLKAMFGEAAIQHAPKGSYPRYFEKAFTRGLRSPEFRSNPFLQHLFFGNYLSLPGHYNGSFSSADFNLIEGMLSDVPHLAQYDLVQLSNIFDWSSLEQIKETCRLLDQKLTPGAIVLIRQINNESPVAEYLGPDFTIHQELADKLQRNDRSLFYSKIIVAEKRGQK